MSHDAVSIAPASGDAAVVAGTQPNGSVTFRHCGPTSSELKHRDGVRRVSTAGALVPRCGGSRVGLY